MGRRSILGDYGREIPQSQHGIPDSELMTGGQYADYRGVSRQRVAMNFKQKLIDRYLDSNGRGKYYPPVVDEQWQEQSEAKAVSLPTRGQAANGMDQSDALLNAGDFSPSPALPNNPGPRGTKNSNPPRTPPKEEPEDAEKAQAKNIYGKARAKSQLHKSQLDEIKVLEATKILVARAPVITHMTNAAQITRARTLAVSDFVIDQLYAEAHSEGDSRQRMGAMRVLLRRALEDALTAVADEEIERINRLIQQ